MAPFGLTASQYGVLASLYAFSQGRTGPSQRELADFTGLEPMHVSKLIRALERAGLVERSGHPVDTRVRRLTVTGRGVEVVTAARAKVLELEEERLAPLGGRDSEQSAVFVEALQTLLRHADAMRHDRAIQPSEPPTVGEGQNH